MEKYVQSRVMEGGAECEAVGKSVWFHVEKKYLGLILTGYGLGSHCAPYGC